MAEKKNNIQTDRPLNYRELQNLNSADYKASSDDVDFLNRVNSANSQRLKTYESSFNPNTIEAESPIKLKENGDYFGNSMWDAEGAKGEDINDLEYLRAENQPWYAKAAAGLTKGALTAATTFTEGVLGIPYGIYAAFHDGDISKIWDNEIGRAVTEINDAAETWLPNYYTRNQQEGPWYSTDNLLSANFLFDKVIKNIGFTVGAAYSGGIYTKGINLAAKGIGGLYALAKTGKNVEKAMELGAKAMQMNNVTRVTKALVGAGFSAMGEGAIEALNNSKEYVNIERQKIDALSAENYNNALEEYIQNGGTVDAQGNPVLDNSNNSLRFQDTVDKIYKAADRAYQEIDATRANMGNADFLANIPLLTMGNLLTFGKMFAGGYKAARNTSKVTTRATKEAMKAAEAEGKEAVERLQNIVAKAKKTGYQGLTEEEKALVEEGTNHILGDKMNAFFKAAQEPLKEGNEEMSQSAAAKASENYYGSRVDAIYDAALDSSSRTQVLSSWQAALQGFKDIYGDFNNYEEGFIGALTGMFGSPTFGKKNNSTSETYLGKSKWVGMSGGVIPQWRNAIKGREDEAQIVSHVNSILKNGNLERDIKHLISQATFNEQQRVAAIRGDKLDYKDSELASIFENIMYLKEANKLDLLSNAINTMSEFTVEDAQEILNLTKKDIDSNGNNINSLNKTIENDTKELEALKQSIEKDREGLDPYMDSLRTPEGYYSYEEGEALKVQSALKKIQEAEKRAEEISNRLERYQQEKEKLNPSTISPYIKSDDSLMSAEEVLQDLNERKEKHNDIINFVTNTIDQIDAATEETLTNDQLKTLTWYKTLMHDWQNRSNNMAQNASNIVSELLENQDISEAIAGIDDLIQGINPDELNAQDKLAYGGLQASRKLLMSRKESLQELRDVLANITGNKKDAGLALARALSNKKEITIGEGKEAKKVKLGDYLYDFIKNSVDSLNIAEDEKQVFAKNLSDLKKIGNNYNKYNELLSDYINHPEKIDEAHAASTAAAEAANRKTKTAKTTNNIRFGSTNGAVANDVRNNIADLENEGIDGWFEDLTEEQKEQYKEASKLAKGIDGVIKAAEDEDENLGNLVKAAIDKNVDSVNNAEELINKLKNEEDLSEAIDKLLDENLDDVAKLDEKEKLEAKFREFIESDEVNKIAKSLDAQEKNNQDKVEEELKKRADAADRNEKEQDNKLKAKGSNAITQEKNKKNTVGKDKTLSDKKKENKRKKKIEEAEKSKEKEIKENEKPTIQETKDAVEKQGTPNDVTNRINRRKKAGYSNAYSNRPQLSETYMYGRNLETYLNYIKEHPERIPKFTVSKLFPNIKNQKDFNEAFIKYIEATHKYLTEQGAFDYVKHNLKANDKLIFTIDKDLNEAAGVPVVVIKAIDSEGNSHVVGTMKSELDFMSINFRTDKTYGETESAQKALYDDIVKKYNELSEENKDKDFVGNTSTVSTLMGGDVAFSNTESTVSSVFENTGDKIIFGVVREEGGNLIIKTGNSEQDKKILNVGAAKKGQVYVLIPSNNGSLLPALCYGTSLLELLSNSNDWYINQIVKAIQDIPTNLQDATNITSLGTVKSNIAKWLGVNASNLHINLAFKDSEGKIKETTDLNQADRISIKYSLNSSNDMIVSTILLNDDDTISEQKALDVVTRIVSEVAKSGDPELQVNLNFLELAKDSSRDEYNSNMSKYYHTNIVQGQTHTVNDWFTYDKTDIEEDNSKKGSRRQANNTKPTPIKRPARPTRKVSSTKETVEIDKGGLTTNEDGKILTDSDKEAAIEEPQTTEEKPTKDKSNLDESIVEGITEKGTEKTIEEKKEDNTKTPEDNSEDLNNDKKDENPSTSEEIQKRNDASSLMGDLLIGGQKKTEDSNKEDSTTNNSKTSKSDEPVVPHKRKARTRNRKTESNAEESNNKEESSENSSSSEFESNQGFISREQIIEFSNKIFADETGVNPVKPIIDKIFNFIDNHEGVHNVIHSIGLVADLGKRLIKPTFDVVNKIYNHFISNMLSDVEKHQLEQEAKAELNIKEDDVDFIDRLGSWTMSIMDGDLSNIFSLKSKKLANLLIKLRKAVKVLSKNAIVTKNFFNNILAQSVSHGSTTKDNISNKMQELHNKYKYNSLSNTVKEFLNSRNILQQDYNKLAPEQQEAIIKCTI